MGGEATVSTGANIRNPVKTAFGLAKKASIQEIKNNTEECAKANDVLTRITKLQSTLLPIEQEMINAINSKRREVANRLKRLESLDKLTQYAAFNLEPLKWRNKQGYPRLAVFNLESPNCEFAVIGGYTNANDWNRRRIWKKRVEPKLPPEMMECYNDVFNRLNEIAKKTKKTIRLSAKFVMLIPPDIKEKIIQVREEFKEIFIIGEAPQWGIKQTAIPKPNKDPLVVGYDGVNYWLIAAFNSTPLEEYIANEKYINSELSGKTQ